MTNRVLSLVPVTLPLISSYNSPSTSNDSFVAIIGQFYLDLIEQTSLFDGLDHTQKRGYRQILHCTQALVSSVPLRHSGSFRVTSILIIVE